jgi:hypothetical protein
MVAASAVPGLAQPGVPPASAVPSLQADDLAFAAYSSLFLGPMDAVQAAQTRLEDARTIAAVANLVAPDPPNDVHGSAPSVVPPELPDIQSSLVMDLPQSADLAFSKACASSVAPQLDAHGNLVAPTGAFWFCPVAGTPTLPLSLIALQLGAALPSSLALPGQQALYIGFGRPDPQHPTGTDAFHAGIGDIYGAGLRHTGAWAPYFEGGALFPQFPALGVTHDVEGAVALMVAQTSLLADGFRPFVSIDSPPKGVASGAWDEVDGTASNRLLYPAQSPDETLAGILTALAGSADSAVTQVISTFIPPLPFRLDGTSAPMPVDPMWAAIGRLTQPGPAPTIDQQFPCDQSHVGISTACADQPTSTGGSLTGGKVAVFEAELAAPPPSGADSDPLQIELALDSDGQTANNWKAAADQPGDSLQGTDRVYAATEDPTTGAWSLIVQQSNGTTWTPAASSARVIVDGSSVVFLVPSSDFTDPTPAWRMIERAQDATATPPSDIFLVSAGTPPDQWSLATTEDPTNVAKAPIAVTGGCIVAQAGVVPTLHVTATIAGVDQLAFPRLVVTVTIPLPPSSGKKAITTPVAPVAINGGIADFMVQVFPSRVRFDKAVIESGTKTVDVTKSWQKVFGSSLVVTDKGGQHAGNQCS